MTLLTVLASVYSADGWDRTSAGNQELIIVADVVHCFRSIQYKVVKVQSGNQSRANIIFSIIEALKGWNGFILQVSVKERKKASSLNLPFRQTLRNKQSIFLNNVHLYMRFAVSFEVLFFCLQRVERRTSHKLKLWRYRNNLLNKLYNLIATFFVHCILYA